MTCFLSIFKPARDDSLSERNCCKLFVNETDDILVCCLCLIGPEVVRESVVRESDDDDEDEEEELGAEVGAV